MLASTSVNRKFVGTICSMMFLLVLYWNIPVIPTQPPPSKNENVFKQQDNTLYKETLSRVDDEGKETSGTSWIRCEAALVKLVDKYFAAHANGITRDMIDHAFHPFEVMEKDSVVIIQVIEDTVYINDQRMEATEWDASRIRFLLGRLNEFLLKRKIHCERVRYKTNCQPNFEFVVDFKDCQSGWAGSRSFLLPGLGRGESGLRYDSLPIFTMTKCYDRHSIPFPQWFDKRDGSFDQYDTASDAFLKSIKVPDSIERKKQAVFIGGFVPMSTFNEHGKPSTMIDQSNWRKLGRGKVWNLGQENPELLYSTLKLWDHHKGIVGDEYKKFAPHVYIPHLEQAKKFRYVVYCEGACGWADRLKHLMLYNSTILLQQTKCHEYYQELMKPFEHYIPVQENLDDLIEKITWARDNDDVAVKCAKNAMELQQKYLSVSNIRCYSQLLFDRYSRLIRYNVTIRDGVRRVSAEEAQSEQL